MAKKAVYRQLPPRRHTSERNSEAVRRQLIDVLSEREFFSEAVADYMNQNPKEISKIILHNA